jgi:hypothetical protein
MAHPATRKSSLRVPELWLLVITGLALYFRLEGLSALWINPDEGIYYQIATRTSPVSVLRATAAHAHPPLYYLLLWGVAKLSTDLSILRLLSVLCGTLTIPTMYYLLRALSAPWVALLFCLGVALAPGHIVLSQTLRPYALFLMILPLTLLGLYRAFNSTDAGPGLKLFSYTLCLLLFIHYASFIVLLSSFCSITLLLLIYPDQRAKWKVFSQTLYPAGIALLAVMAVNFQFALGHGMIRTLRQSDWLLPLYISSFEQLLTNTLGLLGYFFSPALAPLLCVLTISGIFLRLTSCRQISLLVLPPILILAALSWLKLYPLGGSRHSAFLAIYLLIPACLFLHSFFKTQDMKDKVKGLLCAVAAILLVFSITRFSTEITHPPGWEQIVSRQDMRELKREIEKIDNSTPIYCDEQTFQLLTPVLKKKDEVLLLSQHTLTVFPSYRFRHLTDLQDDLTNAIKTPSLLVLSRWGRTGIIDKVVSAISPEETTKLLLRRENIALLIVTPASAVELSPNTP